MVNIVVNKSEITGKLKLSDNEINSLLFNLKSEAKPIDNTHLEVEVNPDRLDMLYPSGIRRAIYGLTEVELGEPKYSIRNSEITFSVDKVPQREYAVTFIARGVNINNEDKLKEIIQFQEKLHATIGRKRKKVAIGIHDLDKLNTSAIAYRLVSKESTFAPLFSEREMKVEEVLRSTQQGKEYGELALVNGTVPAIIDGEGDILSIPPVINSRKTQLEIGTKDLLIDVTGTSFDAVAKTADIIASDFAEGGANVEGVKVLPYNEVFPKMERNNVYLTVEKFSRISGIQIPPQEIVHQIQRMRMDAEFGDRVKVSVPPFRVDILEDVDVVEEILMSIGYNNIPMEPVQKGSLGKADYKQRVINTIRELVIGAGFLEVFSYVLTSSRTLHGDYALISNPISELYDAVRNSLIPSILDVMSSNQSSTFPVKVFEVGDVVIKDSISDTGYSNVTRIAMGIMDSEISYELIQSPVSAILENLGLKPKYRASEEFPFLKGRSSVIEVRGNKIGVLGEVDPNYLLKLKITYPVAICEISIDNLVET
ncbi:phenylalanine--tRNA ligase subunit beta [Sulfolobales archaeon HS-7]|nr:phenylalanine--tRNA ligase subunit beta [Sulfolobales archaeon HS-7]